MNENITILSAVVKRLFVLLFSSVFALSALAQKTDFELSHEWSNLFDGPLSDIAPRIVANSDKDLFLFGSFSIQSDVVAVYGDHKLEALPVPQSTSGNRNFAILKLRADGSVIWSVNSQLGDFEHTSSTIAVTPDGGVIAFLKTRNSAGFDNPQDYLKLVQADGVQLSIEHQVYSDKCYDGVILKLSSDGLVDWYRLIEFDHSKSEMMAKIPMDVFEFNDAAVLSDGSAVVVGNLRTSVAIDGTTFVADSENWDGDTQNFSGNMMCLHFDSEGKLKKGILSTGDVNPAKCGVKATRISVNGDRAYISGNQKGDGVKKTLFGDYELVAPSVQSLFCLCLNISDFSIEWANQYEPMQTEKALKPIVYADAIASDDGSVYLGGRLVGALSVGENSSIETTAGLQTPFVISISTADGNVQGGYCGPVETGIGMASEIMLSKDRVYMYTYDITAKCNALRAFEKSDFSDSELYILGNSKGALTSSEALFCGDRFVCIARTNGIYTPLNAEPLSSPVGYGAVISSFKIPMPNPVPSLRYDKSFSGKKYDLQGRVIKGNVGGLYVENGRLKYNQK